MNRLILALFLLPAAAPPAPEGSVAATADAKTLADALLEAHNRERAKEKLPPLSFDSSLVKAAKAHTDDMAGRKIMSHDGGDGSTPSDRIKRQGYQYQNDGENVGMGYPNVSAVMTGWMNSPHHRENILGKFTQAGFAVTFDDDGKPYWTANFGTPWVKQDPDRASANLVRLVNKARVSAKHPALIVSVKLNKVAEGVALRLAKADTLGGSADGGAELTAALKAVGYRFVKLGLSAASGAPDAVAAVATWTGEEKNRESLMGDFSEAGGGYAVGSSGRPYWCLVLARPAGR